MRFAVYLPPQAQSASVPVAYWLSGLTCTDENFIQKAGAQRVAAELGIAIVAPDTSPRGEGVPDDPEGKYDLGLGAGFYVNATQAPWNAHYQMYDYIVDELPAVVEKNFPVTDKRVIFGHSMGGHGALVIGLRNPGRYESVSAFSPIVHPTNVPWGKKAFTNYLGGEVEAWKQYDATELLSSESTVPILISQGENDEFLERELTPHVFVDKAKVVGANVKFTMHPGYDHSYYFIASFVEDHLRFHGGHLGLGAS